MKVNCTIITDIQGLSNFLIGTTELLTCDTETAKDRHLLGVSLSNGQSAIYIPVTEYAQENFKEVISSSLRQGLSNLLSSHQLIGHNFTYDKRFIDRFFSIQSSWVFDTRLAWHLASAPSGPRPYGLKDAQTEVLGWTETNQKELKREVEERGGKLQNGDHYLASTATLGRYACLDAYSTYALYSKLDKWFVDNDYHWMMKLMMDYNQLLEQNTQLGVAIDQPGLARAHKRLLSRKEAAKKRMFKLLSQEVGSLEEDWKDRHKAKYKREYNRIHYQNHPEKWERFNLNSDVHKRELFFDKLGIRISERTPSGLPSTGADSLKPGISEIRVDSVKQAMESYLVYEKANTLSSNFSGPYIEAASNSGRLHPGFNICGTVSYRLSGFKPYLLNAPFDERLLLKNLRVEETYIGVHADLNAIEPTITAHYSEDPSLLKVFRDGLGDIYLDLALELFPNDRELHEGYNPNIPITKAVKERFVLQRKVAKVIQLAVQYTGTKYTVAKNLSRDGFPTTEEQADRYVRAYWRKFRKVEEMNVRLREINRKEGHLRNVIGRIIQVPDPEYKDLPNRFIQSSAHDVLVLWVSRIQRKLCDVGLAAQPVLLDVHDSTSWSCPKENVKDLEKIFIDSLAEINKELGLIVTVKMEMKRFQTLAGLKNNE